MLPVLQNFSLLFTWTLVDVPAKFEDCSFHSWEGWDNCDWSFGWGLRTPNLGEEEAVGGLDGTIRKSVGGFL